MALDPVTAGALAIGLATGVGFMLVAAGTDFSTSRRFSRRLQGVANSKARATGPAMRGDEPARSLTRQEQGTIPGLDPFIQRWLPRRDVLTARLERTGRQISLSRYLLVNAGLVLGFTLVFMLFFQFALVPSLLFGAGLGVAIPHFVIGRMAKRRIAAFIALFPEAIDLMVRALRSGLPISEAVVNAAHEIGDPIGAEFGTIEAGMRLGRDLETLLWDIGKRIDAPEFRFFIIALSVQRETGGNLAETLTNLSEVLRRRRQMRAKARAMASEARASTAILGALPIVVTLVLFATSPGYIMPLFTDVRGLMLVFIAVSMLLTGIGIMVKMARFEI